MQFFIKNGETNIQLLKIIKNQVTYVPYPPLLLLVD